MLEALSFTSRTRLIASSIQYTGASTQHHKARKRKSNKGVRIRMEETKQLFTDVFPAFKTPKYVQINYLN